jgi:hypothetical protein
MRSSDRRLQVAFEVGGPQARDFGKSMAGVLQAERSDRLDISRFDLMNLGLFPGQTSCLTTPSMANTGDVTPDSYVSSPPSIV